jgi:hypothetical protein
MAILPISSPRMFLWWFDWADHDTERHRMGRGVQFRFRLDSRLKPAGMTHLGLLIRRKLRGINP